MDNKIVNLDEYINTKKFGDAESRKYLLELIQSGFDSISHGLKILTDSFDINERDAEYDIDRSFHVVTKQADIATHMISAIDELDKVFSILDELIEEKKKSEKEKEEK